MIFKRNLMKKTILFGFYAISFWGLSVLCSCTNDDNIPGEDNPMIPIDLSVDEAKTTESINGFALNLLKAAVATNDEAENTAVSPLGAAMVAGMFGNAIDRADRGQLLSVLGVSPMTSLNAYCSKMIESLPKHDSTSRLVIANASWFDTGNVSLSESYKRVLEEDFTTEVKMADFKKSSILEDVNSWINEKTTGAIPEIFDRINDADYALWVSAIYFKGVWKSHYDKVTCRSAIFTKADGTPVEVNMMDGVRQAMGGIISQKANNSLKDGENVDEMINTQISTIEYGNAGFALSLIMPDEKVSIKEFLETNSDMILPKMLSRAVIEYNPVVIIPKLDISVSADLIEPMKALGLNNIFSGVEMSGIGKNNAVVSQFRQKIRLQIDEEGSTQTSFIHGIEDDKYRPDKPMTFNRPFIYFIWEKSTGTILLAGTVMDPTK